MLNSKQVPLEFQTKPKKFKKYHKIKFKNSISSVSSQNQYYAFSGLNAKYLTVKQLLAVLKIIKPEMKKVGKGCLINLNATLDVLLTKKPKDIRMGRGKGMPTERVMVYKAGSTIFELTGLPEKTAKRIYSLCRPKFATKSRYINQNKW